METARYVLTPFYECMDAIIPLSQLQITNKIPDIKPGRFIGNQMIEFSLQLDHSFLLSESKKHKSNKFDIRAIIRFCNAENMNKIDDQFMLKDSFPLHLKLNLNNTIITLPQFLPNDRTGKDGRRFPRPVDLSEGLLDNPLVINKFLIQWVQDECKNETFYFGIYLVRRRTCEELTYILLKKQLSPIKNTLNFIREQSKDLNTAQDDDVMLVNTTINTSLICPVSRVRMTTPVRGQHCTHIQCFDCITYLLMNFNKPTWQCPVCDKKTFFCYLEVDSLIFGILNDARSNSVTNIIFNKNGQWKSDKKLPGTSADEAYNDITSYYSVNEAADNTKSTFQMVPENFTELHTEKYLQQILQSSNNSSLINRFRPPNSMNNMVPVHHNATVPNRINNNALLFPEVHPRAPFVFGPTQSNNKLYNNIGPFQDNIRHISSVTSTMNLNPNVQQHPRFRMAAKPSDQLSMFVGTNRQNLINSQKLKHKSFSNDNSSQIKITNVTSVAKPPNETNVIVISDDENDDIATSSDKESTVKVVTRAQKRPTTVSSVPSEVGSAKFQKLADYYYGQQHMAMRSNAASAPSVLDSQRQECCCTSNTMCAVHRAILLRNKMALETCRVPGESNELKSKDVNIAQTSIQLENFHKNMAQANLVLEQQAAVKNNSSFVNSSQIPELVHPNRNTVKEYLKTMQNQSKKIYNNNGFKKLVGSGGSFTVQHRPTEPLCSIPPDYFQQHWVNMMMSSSQSFVQPENLFHPSTQFNQNNSVPSKNINSFISQPNTFYNC